MKEIVSNLINDEQLCVLFYNKEEEEKKIWDSIRMEETEKIEKAGIKKVVEQNRKEMIISMKNERLELETISKITNLSISKIEEIINN